VACHRIWPPRESPARASGKGRQRGRRVELRGSVPHVQQHLECEGLCLPRHQHRLSRLQLVGELAEAQPVVTELVEFRIMPARETLLTAREGEISDWLSVLACSRASRFWREHGSGATYRCPGTFRIRPACYWAVPLF
jgi:hypothetical protein